MSLLFESAGILTTIQGLGRLGYQKYGIPPGGPMDTQAVRLINLLIGNPEDEKVLEMHFPAPRIRFGSDAVCALGGADLEPRLNGVEVDIWMAFKAHEGDLLEFGGRRSGNPPIFPLREACGQKAMQPTFPTALSGRVTGLLWGQLQSVPLFPQLEFRRH